MREKLGDAKAEQLLLQMFGSQFVPVVPLRLRRSTVKETLALLSDAAEGKPNWSLVPTVFRVYYAEHPQGRGKLIKWLREKDEAFNLEAEIAARNGNGAVVIPMLAAKPAASKRKPKVKARKR